MINCPRCSEKGITIFSKAISNPARPAKCTLCNQLSYKDAGVLLARVIFIIFFGFIGWLVSIVLGSNLPLYIAILLWVSYEALIIYKVPMHPTDIGQVKTARTTLSIVLGAITFGRFS